MKYRRLGKTGIKVSELTLGTNNFGTQVDEETTARIIREAIELGINSIDTANVYTKGRSEEFIGRAIRGDRENVVLATKVGMPIGGDQPNRTGLSRKHILWQVRQSLERLHTDYIDIYYMHRFDAETPLEESLRTLDFLVKEGKVRYAACSNFTKKQMEEAKAVCDQFDLERLVALQPPYSLLNREIERDIMSYCRDEGMGLMVYSPLAGGFLTGKYKRGAPPPPGSRGATLAFYADQLNKDMDYERLDRLLAVSNDSKVPMHHLAMAWIMKHPAVTSLIAGASRPEQLEDNCAAVDGSVPADALERLDKAA